MSIQSIATDIVDEFEMFEDWLQKYDYLIELGRDLPLIDESNRADDNLIKGCQSRVWLQADFEDGVVSYKADSDAIITKGIISLLVRVLSNQKPEDILAADLGFIDTIGLKEHLSGTRANGLLSMVKQMKFYAIAYQSKTA
ncbi:MAG: cysteine desulfuration protein SufE [Flavobacteriales bacterium]|jgi:cysteine desulfuration protein SufE